MIQSRTFRVKHYIDMELDGYLFGGAIPMVPESFLYRLAGQPHVHTLCSPEGYILMIVGVVSVGVGVGEVFILPAKGWVHYTIDICRYIKEQIRNIQMFHHRIQATCRTQDDKYFRFLEMFGFEREGVLRHYDTQGNDYYLYSIISGG